MQWRQWVRGVRQDIAKAQEDKVAHTHTQTSAQGVPLILSAALPLNLAPCHSGLSVRATQSCMVSPVLKAADLHPTPAASSTYRRPSFRVTVGSQPIFSRMALLSLLRPRTPSGPGMCLMASFLSPTSITCAHTTSTCMRACMRVFECACMCVCVRSHVHHVHCVCVRAHVHLPMRYLALMLKCKGTCVSAPPPKSRAHAPL